MISLKRISAALLLAMGTVSSASLHAQTKPNAEPIQTFPLPDPQADEAALSAHKKVLRAEIAIDSATTVRFYEEPTDVTVYNSTVSVERGTNVIATYNVGSLIKHQALRLVHVALLRSGDRGMLVGEYEGGAVGAREGFAILHFSPAGVELHTLPLTDYGKVVVFRSQPERAEIWSARDDGVGAAADPKAYARRSCRWAAKGYVCGSPKLKPGRFSPSDINDPGIEIKP